MTLRVAVVGTGFGAAVHVPGFMRHEKTTVRAIVSRSQARGETIARQHQIPLVFTDFGQMLNSGEIDAVSIVVPTDLHRPLAIAAMEAGLHVLCEKPTALNRQEAIDMLTTARKAKVTHMINHEFRFRPARWTLKRYLDEGRIGRVLQLRMYASSGSWADPRRPFTWLSEAHRGGGQLGAIGSHMIDSLIWWCGPVRSVSADLQIAHRERTDRDGLTRQVTADDGFSLMAELDSGTQATLTYSALSQHPHGLKVEMIGEHGSLMMEEDSEQLWYGRSGQPMTNISTAPPEWGPRGLHREGDPALLSPFLCMVEQFAQGVREGHSPSPHFGDALAVQSVLDAARESHERRRWVPVRRSEPDDVEQT